MFVFSFGPFELAIRGVHLLRFGLCAATAGFSVVISRALNRVASELRPGYTDLETCLDSQVAGSNRPLYPKVDHYWF